MPNRQEAALRVLQLLRRLGDKRGTTTLMVTHGHRSLVPPDRIVRADRIVRMKDGGLSASD
jgi:ABC-type lipoprotein export system ATPase subunit